MKNITALAGAIAVTLSAALAGCTPTTEQASTATTTPTPTVWVGEEHGKGVTLHKYISDNEIAETPFKPNQPGTPKVDFPFPPDWSLAGDRTPDWAYGAIVYDKAKDPQNPPFIVAIASKLTGNVDPAKILELAPGQLNDLPEFKELSAPKKDSLGGFEAIDYAGTYMWEGKPRVVGQQTIVVPGRDNSLFVLQLNGEAPKGEEQVVVDAADFIGENTKIYPPS